MTETEKIRAARAAYMRDYARKRRRSSQEMREREKESRDRYWPVSYTHLRRSACLTLDVPLPVVVLNEYVRKHFSMLMELSDSVSLSNAGGRLRIKCTVCGLWEE